MTITVGSLFAGIGGFDLGLERAGMKVRWQVEIDKFCQRVLAKYWPDVPRFGDVRDFPPSDRREDWAVSLICGGFPCQDVSQAGNQAGIDGERSGLYAEMLRVCGCLRPDFIIIENVDGLRYRGGYVVLRDLAELGYDAEWEVFTACQAGAPHTRKRLFIVAYPNGHGLQGLFKGMAQAGHNFLSSGGNTSRERGWQHLPAPCFCRSVDGISNRVDRTRALGNAVVPQVAEWIGRKILEATNGAKAT